MSAQQPPGFGSEQLASVFPLLGIRGRDQHHDDGGDADGNLLCR